MLGGRRAYAETAGRIGAIGKNPSFAERIGKQETRNFLIGGVLRYRDGLRVVAFKDASRHLPEASYIFELGLLTG